MFRAIIMPIFRSCVL